MKRFSPGRQSSLRTRLILWNVFVLAWILALMGGLIQYTVRTNLYHTIDRDLAKMPPDGGRERPLFIARAEGHNLPDFGENPPPPEEQYAPPPQPGNPPQEEGRPEGNPGEGPGPPHRPGAPRRPGLAGQPPLPFRVRFLDLEGKSLRGSSSDTPWDWDAFRQALQRHESHTSTVVKDEPVRVYTRPIFDAGRVIGVMQNAYPLADLNRAIAGMNGTLLALLPVALLLAGLGGAMLTDRALKPIRRITQTAEQIGAEDLSRRLVVVGQDEFARLATTFNGMLARLETTFTRQENLVAQLEEVVAQQRRFTGDASHELRTPLTIIKANTSLLLPGHPSQEDYREAIEDIDRAADAMTRLVQDLLILTRSDGGQLGRNAVQLSVQDVLENAQRNVRKPETAPIHLEIADSSLTIFGNADELTRLFSNLLENAARYTPKEGSIRLTAQGNETQVRVRVADTGIGIAPEHLPHLCERFYRVDAARSRPDGGTGLGLAICKSIVEAHGGTLEIASQVGKGTTVTVTLPRTHVSAS